MARNLFLCSLLATVAFGPNAVAQSPSDVKGVAVGATGARVRVLQRDGSWQAAVSRDGGHTWSDRGAPDYSIRWRQRSFDLLSGDPAVPPLLRAGNSNQLFFVQFVTDVMPEYRSALESLGADLGHYVPNQSLIARMSASVRRAVEAQPWVRAVGPVHPAHKFDPSITDAFVSEKIDKDRYVIMLVDKHRDGPVLERAIRDLGGSVILPSGGSVIMEATLSPAQLLQVAHENTVIFVEQWAAPEFDIDQLRVQAGVNFVETAAGIDGKGMNGHILEGVEATHPEFLARLPFRTAPQAVLNGANSGHGTNTAGEIYAAGVDPVYKGILPFAQMSYTNYSGAIINTNNRYGLTQTLVDPNGQYRTMFQTASWGYPRDTDYTARSAEMDDILFDFDHLWVTNSQSNAGATSIPQNSRPQAWAKNVCGIGGFRHQNNSNPADDCWCTSGSTGPAADGRVGVSFAAYYDSIRTTSTGGGYRTTFGGTSGATPIVNGLGGAVIQMFTDGMFGYPAAGSWQNRFGLIPNLTTTRVLMTLCSRQLPIASSTRPQQGWGLPNLEDLYNLRDNLLVVDEEDVLGDGQSRAYYVLVKPGTAEFRASMHHLEDEAVPFANPTRINSLDLEVTAPDGTRYFGNDPGILSSSHSSSGGFANDVDVHENVFLDNPAAGIYEVKVTATAVRADSHKETPEVDADFALAVGGIGGGRDRSGPILDLISNAPGQFDVSLTNSPATYTAGWTLMSASTDRHVGLGNFLGIEADALTTGIFGSGHNLGDVFAFIDPGAAPVYPNTTFSFPPAIAMLLQGFTFDAVATYFHNGQFIAASNVDRVTIQ